MATFPGLEDIINKRNQLVNYAGGNSYWFVERIYGKMVEVTAFEPSPNTCRSNYYYNSAVNALYKKLKLDGVYVWKKISI